MKKTINSEKKRKVLKEIKKEEYISLIDMFNMEISDFAEFKRQYLMHKNSVIKMRSNSMDIKILDRINYLLKIIPSAIKFKERNIIYYKKNKPKEIKEEVLVIEIGLKGGDSLDMTDETNSLWEEKKDRKYFSRLYIPHLIIDDNSSSHSEEKIWEFEANNLLEVLEETYKFLKENKYLQISIHRGNY